MYGAQGQGRTTSGREEVESMEVSTRTQYLGEYQCEGV